jgi:pilus assembly protein Flp/PilA
VSFGARNAGSAWCLNDCVLISGRTGIVPRDSDILNLDQGCFRDPVLQLVHGRWGNLLRMITLVRKFWADETGATAIEYGLIAAGIALAIIATVNGLGTKLNTKFSSINTSLQ